MAAILCTFRKYRRMTLAMNFGKEKKKLFPNEVRKGRSSSVAGLLERMKRGGGINGLDDKSRGMEILMAEAFAKINPTDPLILAKQDHRFFFSNSHGNFFPLFLKRFSYLYLAFITLVECLLFGISLWSYFRKILPKRHMVRHVESFVG